MKLTMLGTGNTVDTERRNPSSVQDDGRRCQVSGALRQRHPPTGYAIANGRYLVARADV